MARVIQEHIKKPLAEEVLFGRLKSGGHVRVIVITGFDYPDGPGTARADKPPDDTPRRGTVPNHIAASQRTDAGRQRFLCGQSRRQRVVVGSFE
jgi:C-terminal, D2-small domain, of ClpB protein